jgi:hypothetical protein
LADTRVATFRVNVFLQTNQTQSYERSSAQAQDVPGSIKPLLSTKRIAGVGKEGLANNNWGNTDTNWFVVLAEGPDMFRLGTTAAGGTMNSPGNLSFTKITCVERTSGSLTNSQPEGMELLWLKACVTW